MIDPDVFLQAAELIDAGETQFCCVALDALSGGDTSMERRFFEELFSPHGYPTAGPWFFGPVRMQDRVIALCFAAVIAEDEFSSHESESETP